MRHKTNEHAKEIINEKHVNKVGVFRDSYQSKELCSKSPKHGGCPTKPP